MYDVLEENSVKNIFYNLWS